MKGPGAKAAEEVGVVPERVYIRLANAGDSQMLMSLKQAIDENKGPTDVVLVLGPDANKQAIKLPAGMNSTEPALAKLQELVGHENVKLR